MNFPLDSDEKSTLARQCLFAAFSLFLFLLIIYSNSFHGEWHFDDFDNIVENQNVHLSSLNRPEIQKTFFFRGNVSRPLSYLSFALNYYWGGTEVFGYHLVNFGIHFLTAFFLFLLIRQTLLLPLLRPSYGDSSYGIALMASFLWAASPVQVPAVTIIVQRMASMAGLFYVFSMYFYVLGRTGEIRRKKVSFFVLSGIFALLSFGTKENTVMLVASLFLYDLILIQGVTRRSLKKTLPFVLLPLLIILVMSVFYLDFSSFLDGYRSRPFTLAERLLTEPRILIFYLSLLFYPVNERLALLHDVEISRSLFEPWTTFPAILAVLLFILTAFFLVRRKPLIAFCILFFFLNHLIEASIIPLELIFEHRNYVPSLFIFIPAALLILKALKAVSHQQILRITAVACFAGMITMSGQAVFARNGVLVRDVTLWLDNGLKYPHLSLVHMNIAKNYLDYGFRKEALWELHRALQENRYASTFQKALVHYNLGQMYSGEGQDEIALAYYRNALAISPSYGSAMAGIAALMLKEGDNEAALAYIEKSLQNKPNHAGLNDLAGIAFLRLGRFREATESAQKALSQNPKSFRSLMVLAECARRSGNIDEAVRHWIIFLKNYPADVGGHMALIELSFEAGGRMLLEQTIIGLMKLKGQEDLKQFLQQETRPTQELQIYTPNVSRVLAIMQKNCPAGVKSI